MSPRSFLSGLLASTVAAAAFLAPGSAGAQASVTGQWARMNNLPIVPIHLVMLPNGKVMMWGKNFAQALWDPVTQTTSALPNPGYDLFCAGHTYLGDGRVLVAGGHIADFVGLPNASIYDPATNSWTRVPNMNAGRWYPTVTTLPNGDALVVSGQIDTTVGVNPLPQVFQRSTNSWRSLSSAELSQGLYPMMFVTPGGKVLDAAPTHVTRMLDTTGSGSWGSIMFRTSSWRDYATATHYGDGKILVAGGVEPPVASAEVIDLDAPTPTWRAVGSMAIPRRYHTSTILPDGSVLITGGTAGAAGPALAAELWNPATERFTTMASQQVPRMYHAAAILLPDGRVATTGGDGYSDVEVFSPPYLFKGARPTLSGVPQSIGYGQQFTVNSPDAAGIGKVTLVRLGAPTHGFDQNQRINTLPFTAGSGTLTLTAPANANVAPPGPYMLFIINGNGVPSVAGMVNVGTTGSAPPPPPAAPPTVSTLSPASATAGAPAFTLTVTGTNFVSGAVVRWNGSPRQTSFVSGTQLSAAIPATDIAAAGTAQISVANPSGATSANVAYTVNPASTPPPPPAPPPAVSSLSPGAATAGAQAFTLTVNGSNFVSGAVVRWNGAGRTTTFVSGTQVQAAITAADIGTAGTAQVSVLNPGGTASGKAAFTINPASTGSCVYPAWVQGRQYAAGSIVTYNGSLYYAKFANPGYTPTISTYYWAPYQCPTSGGTCNYPLWVQGRQYAAGAIVNYNGSFYIARFANPGYNPTISTYYWAPYKCP